MCSVLTGRVIIGQDDRSSVPISVGMNRQKFAHIKEAVDAIKTQ